jgi:hypothetical protein
MRKHLPYSLLLAFTLWLLTFPSIAQDNSTSKPPEEKSAVSKPQRDTAIVMNKKGRAILPQKNDIGIGFNMIPVIDLFFQSLKFNQPYPGADSLVQYTQNSNNQIVGKFFLDDNTAIRVRFGINTLSGQITSRVQDAKVMYDAGFGTADDIAAASLIKVDDVAQFRKSNILITVGYEKRRGYRRLQGVYGAEVGFGRISSGETFTYGNAFSDLYPVEYTTNFNTLSTAIQTPTTATRVERTTKAKNETGYRYGVRGFVGIEYFIFTKISIGVEYGWGFSITTQRATSFEQEVYFNGQNGPTVITEEINSSDAQRQSGFSLDNNNGSIFSMNNTLGGNTLLAGGAGALTLLFHF